MWIKCTKCGGIKPLWRFNRARAKKLGISTRCKVCDNAAAKKWMSDNKERRKEYRRKYYLDNKGREISKMKEWSSNNRIKHNNIKAKHKKNNRSKFTALESARRARNKLYLTEIESFELDVIYSISSMLGDEYHVDHIRPLSKGGLHHPDNLQIINKSENLKKNNRLNYNVNGIKIFWQENELIVEENNG